ncbi:MAG TPA: PKD domain-containing protein, partial [Thermoplasmata archaeon]|nr:PKD domain-containing protein [Thermoplasmata archaeon]
LDVSPFTLCSDSGDCFPTWTDAVQTFVASTGTVTHNLVAAHAGTNLSFALAFTESALGPFDDGDSLPLQVPVPNFVNDTQFGPAVNRSFTIPGDVDSSDNPLQTGVITALYGALDGLAVNSSSYAPGQLGPVNWTAGENHVVVWVGATAPVNSNYTEYECPLAGIGCSTAAKGTMPTCEPSTGLSSPLPTCEGWTSSQNGNPNDSIAALSHSGSACLNSSWGHCTVDSVILNATSTDPASKAWATKNVSGYNRTVVRLDTGHIVEAGCNISVVTGGSWDGPLNSTCGNWTGTLGSAGSSGTNSQLVSALSNVSLGTPGSPSVGSPIGGAPMFRFVLTPAFAPAPDLNAVATCASSTGPLAGCPQSPSISHSEGRTILGWNWTSVPGHASLSAGDVWTASFDVEAAGGPANATPVDECTTIACASVENLSSGSAFSGAEFAPWGLSAAWNESFPLLLVPIVAAPRLAGTLSAPVTLADAQTSLGFGVYTSGGYLPFTVSFDFGDGTTVHSSSLFANHTYASAGSYRLGVTVRDPSGASLNFSRGITILPTLTASVGPASSTGAAPYEVTLSANPHGGESPYAIAWNFGDGSVGTGATV